MVYNDITGEYTTNHEFVNSYMERLHDQIFALSNVGKLGSVTELFNLPKFLRDYYYNKLVDQNQKQQQMVNQQASSMKIPSRPNFGKRYTR